MTEQSGGFAFSYNAYLYVGHFEKPVAMVDAIMSSGVPRGYMTGHVGCLAAIMMFRLNVHHPICLKKFENPLQETVVGDEQNNFRIEPECSRHKWFYSEKADVFKRRRILSDSIRTCSCECAYNQHISRDTLQENISSAENCLYSRNVNREHRRFSDPVYTGKSSYLKTASENINDKKDRRVNSVQDNERSCGYHEGQMDCFLTEAEHNNDLQQYESDDGVFIRNSPCQCDCNRHYCMKYCQTSTHLSDDVSGSFLLFF